MQNTTVNVSKAWYQNRIMWLVVSVPVLSVLVSAALIYTSSNTSDSLVEDNWYLDGKALEVDLSKDANASLNNIKAQLTLDAQGWRAVISSNTVMPDLQLLQLNLYHTTLRTLDRSFVLKKAGEGVFVSAPLDQQLNARNIGKYVVELSGTGWRLRQTSSWPISQLSLVPMPLTATQLTP